jgi:hypothetical protein
MKLDKKLAATSVARRIITTSSGCIFYSSRFFLDDEARLVAADWAKLMQLYRPPSHRRGYLIANMAARLDCTDLSDMFLI